jgi:hypothetical protein
VIEFQRRKSVILPPYLRKTAKGRQASRRLAALWAFRPLATPPSLVPQSPWIAVIRVSPTSAMSTIWSKARKGRHRGPGEAWHRSGATRSSPNQETAITLFASICYKRSKSESSTEKKAHPVLAYFCGCTTSRDRGRRPRTGTPNATNRVWEPDLAFFAFCQQHDSAGAAVEAEGLIQDRISRRPSERGPGQPGI